MSSHVQPLFFQRFKAHQNGPQPSHRRRLQVDDFLGDGTFGRVLLARDTNRERNRGEARTSVGGRWSGGNATDGNWGGRPSRPFSQLVPMYPHQYPIIMILPSGKLR